jgi:branched-chain amino acid transport system permease protein
MSDLAPSLRIERWTPISRVAIGVSLLVMLALAFAPAYLSANLVDRLTTLFVYVILAVTWNALAGYGGLVSIGQQCFFGLGAYVAVRLADWGVNVYLGLFLAAIVIGIAGYGLSFVMLRLREGEFAIGMWVLAELAHLLVNLDTLVQGETGTSLIALNYYTADTRRELTYWAGLVAMIAILTILFALLRSRTGTAIQAIRDNEEAAASLGVRVMATKRTIFVVAALGAALAGSIFLSTSVTFQPKTYFSVQWTAYMIFMVLVGGLGTFEGAIIGAVLFFLIEAWFGAYGVWYLVGLGATALIFALFFPKGIWGAVQARFDLTLLPVGYRVVGRK